MHNPTFPSSAKVIVVSPAALVCLFSAGIWRKRTWGKNMMPSVPKCVFFNLPPVFFWDSYQKLKSIVVRIHVSDIGGILFTYWGDFCPRISISIQFNSLHSVSSASENIFNADYSQSKPWSLTRFLMVFSCLKRTAFTPLKTGKSPKGNSWTRTIDFQGQFIQFMEENSPRNDILTGPDGPREWVNL